MADIYKLLLECYRSGQIDEKRWQEHLMDDALGKYVEGVKTAEDTTGPIQAD